jgi:acetophenone carboxylase
MNENSVRITEYLDIDVGTEMWCCHVCARALVSARENYKCGCVVAERDPQEIYPPVFPTGDWQLTVAPGYGTFVEFYCPGCGTMVENELLPEGYPPTHDIEVDVDALKAKVAGERGSATAGDAERTSSAAPAPLTAVTP